MLFSAAISLASTSFCFSSSSFRLIEDLLKCLQNAYVSARIGDSSGPWPFGEAVFSIDENVLTTVLVDMMKFLDEDMSRHLFEALSMWRGADGCGMMDYGRRGGTMDDACGGRMDDVGGGMMDDLQTVLTHGPRCNAMARTPSGAYCRKSATYDPSKDTARARHVACHVARRSDGTAVIPSDTERIMAVRQVMKNGYPHAETAVRVAAVRAAVRSAVRAAVRAAMRAARPRLRCAWA